jgi:nucleotide-binding universal stress UspA family protein
MMTAEGPQGLRKMVFGSTSLHLMRKCPCPVWVSKGRPGNYSGILAAVDPSAPSDDKDRLNRTILELASSLARVERSELHIAHAWDFSGNDLVASRSEITQEILDGLMRKNETLHRNRVDALLADCDLRDVPVEIHLSRGRPEWVIPELAQDKGIELIVMGTVSRSGLPGLFIGNTAEHVLQRLGHSVLAVKPDGFVSPVQSDDSE